MSDITVDYEVAISSDGVNYYAVPEYDGVFPDTQVDDVVQRIYAEHPDWCVLKTIVRVTSNGRPF